MSERQYSDQDILTVAEAAAYLRIGRSSAYKLTQLAEGGEG